MLISQIGGEFGLIKSFAGKKINKPDVIKGIGDDSAVIKYSSQKYMLLTTDMLVERRHFNLDWQTPFQIGKKLMEANVSDIVAMGGIPKHALISLALKKQTSVEFVDGFYRGLYVSAARHNVTIVGGDISRGGEYVFNLALVGEVKKKLMRLRSTAKVGDLICVTGDLGGSAAGLRILEKYKHHGIVKSSYIKRHLEPVSRRAKVGQLIAGYAHAMIDVSDGLASEVRHICEESGVGGRIYRKKIPISKNTKTAARMTKSDPHKLALYGGEDFEIVFTLPENDLEKLRLKFRDFSVVGEILGKEEGVYILKDEKRIGIGRGFDHFA